MVRLERLWGAAVFALAVGALTALAPAQPAGACSIADPCWDSEGTVELAQPTFELLEGDSEALPPEWLDSDGVLRFDGTGYPIGIELLDADFRL